MIVNDIVNSLEQYFPLSLALSWDNCGLQIGSLNQTVTKVVVALTPEIEVIHECIDHGANLLITHHPLFFDNLKSIDLNSPMGKIIELALTHHICIYSLHTCLDIGTTISMNHWLLEELGLTNFENADDEGILKIASCHLSVKELSHLCKEKFHLTHTKIVGNLNSIVNQVGIVGGSGGSYILTAVNLGLDCLITGDLKYHDAQLAKRYGLNLIDISHFAENIFTYKMAQLIENMNVKCFQSKQQDYFILDD